uniref:Filamin C, gamma b (actin binding protein 280) n=1 Tax=Paramormyrops kingsleyae TaxID=1676925 RepID=A0A3B3R661_9TELE
MYLPSAPGDYDINISFGGQPIPGSPFRVPIKAPVDPSKVKCSGPGLGSGVRAQVPQTFTVDTSKAGVAPLQVQLVGPTVDINCEDSEDGTCKVTYCPTEPGNYIINIKFADQHVPGKPHHRCSMEVALPNAVPVSKDGSDITNLCSQP